MGWSNIECGNVVVIAHPSFALASPLKENVRFPKLQNQLIRYTGIFKFLLALYLEHFSSTVDCFYKLQFHLYDFVPQYDIKMLFQSL